MSNHNRENIFNKQCRIEEKKTILDLIQSKDPMEKIEFLREKNILVKSYKCTNENCKFKGEREMSWKKRTAPGSDKPVGDLWWFRCTASKCTTWKSCRAHSFFEMFQLTLTTLLTLIFNWAMLMKQSDTLEITVVARQTLVSFYQNLRFLVTKAFDRDHVVFGGPGSIVKIDESLYVKVKHGTKASSIRTVGRRIVESQRLSLKKAIVNSSTGLSTTITPLVNVAYTQIQLNPSGTAAKCIPSKCVGLVANISRATCTSSVGEETMISHRFSLLQPYWEKWPRFFQLDATQLTCK